MVRLQGLGKRCWRSCGRDSVVKICLTGHRARRCQQTGDSKASEDLARGGVQKEAHKEAGSVTEMPPRMGARDHGLAVVTCTHLVIGSQNSRDRMPRPLSLDLVRLRGS